MRPGSTPLSTIGPPTTNDTPSTRRRSGHWGGGRRAGWRNAWPRRWSGTGSIGIGGHPWCRRPSVCTRTRQSGEPADGRTGPGAAVGKDPVVLVTGAGGQVGRALRSEIPDARFLSRLELDVTDPAAVQEAVDGVDVVAHLAAQTNVDECERDPDRANAVNAEGTAHVVRAAGERGARVVYVSTDYVFDGTKSGEYVEEDPPAPTNAYGLSKLAGEGHVQGGPANLIVRTSWVFGEGRNFPRTIVAAARQGGPLRVVDDQWGRPTWAQDLARSLGYLIRTEAVGVLHV